MSNFLKKKFSSIPVLLVQLAPITEPRKSIKINLSHCRLAVHWDYPQGQGKVTSSMQARQSLQRPRHWIVCLSLWRCFSFSSGNTFLKGFPTQALWLSKGPILLLPKGWWRVSYKVGKEEWVFGETPQPCLSRARQHLQVSLLWHHKWLPETISCGWDLVVLARGDRRLVFFIILPSPHLFGAGLGTDADFRCWSARYLWFT